MKKGLYTSLLFFFIHLSCLPVLAQWSSGLALRSTGMVATNAGNKALFAGGFTYVPPGFTNTSNEVEIYDGITNTWSTTALSLPRQSVSAIGVGNLAFFAGGQSGNSVYSPVHSTIDIYNATTNQWTAANLSEARFEIATVSTGGKVYFIGGIKYYYDRSSKVDIYDIATNQWASLQGPVGYLSPRAVSAGNKIVVTAAYSYGVGSFSLYDVSKGQWTTKYVPLTRKEVTITAAGNKVFFAGGYTSDEAISDRVDIYDATTDQWSVAQLSQARSATTAFTAGSKTFFAGGSNNSNVVDIYDASTNQWTTATLSQGRSGIKAISAGTKVFFAGGQVSNLVDVYDTATDQWMAVQLPRVKGDMIVTQAGERALFAENNGGGNDPSNLGKVDIYTTNPALPVSLISFSGKWIENIGTQLSWTTSLETNNDHFQIQRSNDAKSFESIGRVQGKGSTTKRTEYSFTDAHMPDPINYYRLKQVDLDGSVHFSNIISVRRQENTQSIKLSVWPSPTTGKLNLGLTGGKTIQQLGIYDVHGRKISSQSAPQSTTDVTALATGAYVIDVLTTDGQHVRSRFVKQ